MASPNTCVRGPGDLKNRPEFGEEESSLDKQFHIMNTVCRSGDSRGPLSQFMAGRV